MAATNPSRDVISELYTSLCGDPELSATVQWRIYRYAARAKKYTLMARLLALPSLDPELDTLLGTHEESKVRAAWIGRTGRPVEDVLAALQAARKGPVYTAAAAVTGLPKTAYRTLVGDGRPDTARELLKNPDVPVDVKAAAAVTFGREYKAKRTWTSGRALADLFADQLGLLPHLVSETTNPVAVGYAAERVALPAAELTRVLDEVITPALRDPVPATNWEGPYALTDAVKHLLGQPNLTRAQRDALLQHAQAYLAVNHRQHLSAAANAIPDAYRNGPLSLPTASHSHLDQMRDADTAADVAAAAKVVAATRDAELAIALACNSAADATTVEEILPVIPRELRARVAQARARDIDVLAAVVVHNDGYDILSDELLAASGQPAEALIAIVREYRKSGKKMSARLGRSEYLTPSVMGALPLSFTSKKGSMLARRAVGDLLTNALDSDRDWELFETLGNNFDGPLENLLLACGYVVAPTNGQPDNGSATSGETTEDDGVVDPDGIATWSLF